MNGLLKLTKVGLYGGPVNSVWIVLADPVHHDRDLVQHLFVYLLFLVFRVGTLPQYLPLYLLVHNLRQLLHVLVQ